MTKKICDFFSAELKIFSEPDFRDTFLEKYKSKKVKPNVTQSDQIDHLQKKVTNLEKMNEEMLRISRSIAESTLNRGNLTDVRI